VTDSSSKLPVEAMMYFARKQNLHRFVVFKDTSMNCAFELRRKCSTGNTVSVRQACLILFGAEIGISETNPCSFTTRP